nr:MULTISPECIES: 2-oxo-4-hydroxy-4-carboxy-5-ureidoimidazoline decarboxylase [unclassified Acinetobacter]
MNNHSIILGDFIVQLVEFNKASEADVKTFLKHCVQIEGWAEHIVAQRPYTCVTQIIEQAVKAANAWTWDEIKNALDNHPRIGEKKAQAELSCLEQQFSNREQSEISADEETQFALLKGNIAYEKKYGYLFLIKASGLSSEDVLQALQYRLLNDPETEKRIVHHQLAEIALLRLKQELSA